MSSMMGTDFERFSVRQMNAGVIKTLRMLADELEQGKITMRYAMGKPPAKYDFIRSVHSYTTGMVFEIKLEDDPTY